MAKFCLIAKMRKRSKILPGDHFATVSLQWPKAGFWGRHSLLQTDETISTRAAHTSKLQKIKQPSGLKAPS